MIPRTPLVVVFGSSRSEAGDSHYEAGVRLGRLLTRKGLRVATGGYGGMMEAVSRGASEVGGKPIGVTFAAFGEVCNSFVAEQQRHTDLFDRLRTLATDGDAFVVLRGGMGTLAELMLVWIHVEGQLRPPVPVVLVGDCWPPLLQILQDAFTVSAEDVRLLTVVETVEEAVASIARALSSVS